MEIARCHFRRNAGTEAVAKGPPPLVGDHWIGVLVRHFSRRRCECSGDMLRVWTHSNGLLLFKFLRKCIQLATALPGQLRNLVPIVTTQSAAAGRITRGCRGRLECDKNYDASCRC